jgi:hypothetical protein
MSFPVTRQTKLGRGKRRGKVGESHDVCVIKRVNTEDIIQARRSFQMPGGGDPWILQGMNRRHGSMLCIEHVL